MLEIAADFPGFYYQYYVCKKKWLFGCKESDLVVEKYDLTDPIVRRQFKDMDFVAVRRDNP